jgi:hypothetical protein
MVRRYLPAARLFARSVKFDLFNKGSLKRRRVWCLDTHPDFMQCAFLSCLWPVWP